MVSGNDFSGGKANQNERIHPQDRGGKMFGARVAAHTGSVALSA
jgi:hypothetical protein